MVNNRIDRITSGSGSSTLREIRRKSFLDPMAIDSQKWLPHQTFWQSLSRHDAPPNTRTVISSDQDNDSSLGLSRRVGPGIEHGSYTHDLPEVAEQVGQAELELLGRRVPSESLTSAMLYRH